MPSRRDTLKSALIAAGGVSAGALGMLAPFLGGETLAVGSRAQQAAPVAARGRRAVPYGAAVRDTALASDPDYRTAILRHCDQIVSEAGMKWADLRAERERFDFSIADRHMALASDNRMEYRGHTLVWYAALPPWAERMTSAAEAEREMVRHIETVVGRYQGRVRSWDVVNEPIAERPRHRDDMRESVWQRLLGPAHVGLALRTAARVDPRARLVVNEYDIEFVGEQYRVKREALLRLLRDLKTRGAPIHGVGLQGHLRGNLTIDTAGLSAFVSEVRAMGLEVLVTELDVIDDALPGPPDLRDMLAAARVHDFLGAIFAAARPTSVITWGISDKHTWVPIWFKRADGLPNRPLPLDEAYRPKPMMRVIEHFCGGPA